MVVRCAQHIHTKEVGYSPPGKFLISKVSKLMTFEVSHAVDTVIGVLHISKLHASSYVYIISLFQALGLGLATTKACVH